MGIYKPWVRTVSPFIFYDYSADFEGEIYGGHDLHQAAKLYYENCEERRPTPKSWADLDTY